jgi:hypothetical protein
MNRSRVPIFGGVGMAHSFITYRGNERLVNDAEIALVVYTVLAFAASGQEEKLSDNLERLLELWSRVIDNCGPGCIELELTPHLETEVDRISFLELAANAQRYLLQFSEGGKGIAFRKAIAPIQSQSIQFEDILSIDQINRAFSNVLAVVKDSSS